MARIHTDFIVMSEADYITLLNFLPHLYQCDIIDDVPISDQVSLERKLHDEGKFVLKKLYVK